MLVNFKQIGRRVKEIRVVKCLSQAELAEQIGMSAPYISLIETGVKKASLSTLLLIANAKRQSCTTFGEPMRQV